MNLRIFVNGFFVIFLFLIIGTCRKAGTWLVKEDEIKHADIIVLLMGSVCDRVLWAADLYHEGYANKVFMVETNPYNDGTDYDEYGEYFTSNTVESHYELVVLGIDADSIIILPGGATSTKMEVMIIRDYLIDKTDLDTILLISSAEHLRRASMIFKSAFFQAGMSVDVVCSPSKFTNYHAEKWWRDQDDIRRVLLEYIKIGKFLIVEKRRLSTSDKKCWKVSGKKWYNLYFIPA